MKRAVRGVPELLSLCYHYIRYPKNQDPFPRILGNTIDDFREHLERIGRNFQIVSPDEVRAFFYGKRGTNFDCGVILTFDDGLSDHFLVAKILAENGIRAFFFVPTCIITENLPANPTIIHYGLACYGIEKFLKFFREAMGKNTDFDIHFRKGDNPRIIINQLKSFVKYSMGYSSSRETLLGVYQSLILSDRPDAMSFMHLSEAQIKEMAAMGHTFGTHSHSHISIASTRLTPEELEKEIIEPAKILESSSGRPVYAMSYPFGEELDCLTTKELASRTKRYELAFTIKPVINNQTDSPLAIGRYMITSKDTSKTIIARLMAMKGGQ